MPTDAQIAAAPNVTIVTSDEQLDELLGCGSDVFDTAEEFMAAFRAGEDLDIDANIEILGYEDVRELTEGQNQAWAIDVWQLWRSESPNAITRGFSLPSNERGRI